MLWTTSVILFVFWMLGISESFTAGGYIHVLLGMSLAVVVIQFARNRIDLAREKQKYEGAFHLQGRKEESKKQSARTTLSTVTKEWPQPRFAESAEHKKRRTNSPHHTTDRPPTNAVAPL